MSTEARLVLGILALLAWPAPALAQAPGAGTSDPRQVRFDRLPVVANPVCLHGPPIGGPDQRATEPEERAEILDRFEFLEGLELRTGLVLARVQRSVPRLPMFACEPRYTVSVAHRSGSASGSEDAPLAPTGLAGDSELARPESWQNAFRLRESDLPGVARILYGPVRPTEWFRDEYDQFARDHKARNPRGENPRECRRFEINPFPTVEDGALTPAVTGRVLHRFARLGDELTRLALFQVELSIGHNGTLVANRSVLYRRDTGGIH